MPNKMTGLLQDPTFMLGAGILANNTGHYGAFGPAFGAGVFQAGQAQRRNQIAQSNADYRKAQMQRMSQKAAEEEREREIEVERKAAWTEFVEAKTPQDKAVARNKLTAIDTAAYQTYQSNQIGMQSNQLQLSETQRAIRQREEQRQAQTGLLAEQKKQEELSGILGKEPELAWPGYAEDMRRGLQEKQTAMYSATDTPHAAKLAAEAAQREANKPVTVSDKQDLVNPYTGEVVYKNEGVAGDDNKKQELRRLKLKDGTTVTGYSNPYQPGTYTGASGQQIPPELVEAVLPSIQTTQDNNMTTAARTEMQKSYRTSSSLIKEYDNALAIADETDFGATGWFRKTWQDVRAQGGAVAEYINIAQSEARQEDPAEFTYDKWFDPDLPALDVLKNTIAYKVAKELDDGGRLSDYDVQRSVEKNVGGNGPFANYQDFRARMDIGRRRSIGNLNDISGQMNNPMFPVYAPKDAGKDDYLRSLYR